MNFSSQITAKVDFVEAIVQFIGLFIILFTSQLNQLTLISMRSQLTLVEQKHR